MSSGFIHSASGRALVQRAVQNSKHMTGGQLASVLACFPGPLDRSLWNKINQLAPALSTQELPQVLYTIASRNLDGTVPPFLLKQFEASSDLETKALSASRTAKALYSLAKLDSKTYSTANMFDRLVASLEEKDLKQLQGEDLALVMWSLAQQQKQDAAKSSSLAEKTIKAALQRGFDAFAPTDFAKFVHSVHKLNNNEELRRSVITKASKHFFELPSAEWKRKFTPQEFTSILLALAPVVPHAQNERLWENVSQLLLGDAEVLPSWNAVFQTRALRAMEEAAPQLAPALRERLDALRAVRDVVLARKPELEAEAAWERHVSQLTVDPDAPMAAASEEEALVNADLDRVQALYGVRGLDQRVQQHLREQRASLLPGTLGLVLDLGCELPQQQVKEEAK